MKHILIALITLIVSTTAYAQEGKSPFCDSVNTARANCQTIKADCKFMMGDLDATTLDTMDQIKACPRYPATGAQTPKDLEKLVCCLGK